MRYEKGGLLLNRGNKSVSQKRISGMIDAFRVNWFMVHREIYKFVTHT